VIVITQRNDFATFYTESEASTAFSALRFDDRWRFFRLALRDQCWDTFESSPKTSVDLYAG